MRMRTPPHQVTTEPVDCTCAKCGGPAVIYPVPRPRGTCICKRCSPPWAADFVNFLLQQEQEGGK